MLKKLLVSLTVVAGFALAATPAAANQTVGVTCEWRLESTTTPTNPSTSPIPGAPNVQENWTCRVEGVIQRNIWVNTGGNTPETQRWFRFDANGFMQTGWTRVGAQWFYLNDGRMELANGNPVNNNLAPDAATNTGADVLTLGLMRRGHLYLPFSNTNADHYYFFFGQNGAMRTGWQSLFDGRNFTGSGLENGWYRFRANGTQILGWTQGARGVWYFMDPADTGSAGLSNQGRMIYGRNGDYGRLTLPRSNSRLNSDIAVNPSHFADFLIDGSGAMLVGAHRRDWNNVRWDAGTGTTAPGWQTFVTERNGALVIDTWEQVDGSWYRTAPTGHALTGTTANQGIHRVSDAVRGTNANCVTENAYTTGNCRTRYFHFNGDGVMSANGWVNLAADRGVGAILPGGVQGTQPVQNYVHAAADGVLAQGWRRVSNHWYFFGLETRNESGAPLLSMVTGGGNTTFNTAGVTLPTYAPARPAAAPADGVNVFHHNGMWLRAN